jgi:hypothetical protein
MKQIVPLIFSACLLGMVFLVQKEIDLAKGRLHPINDFEYLPSGKILKVAALEFDMVAADLLWLQALQFIGERGQTAVNDNGLYHAIDRVTDLDPAFSYAYQVGGISLSVLSDQIDWSNAILNKGIQNNIKDWNIPLLLAFNYFYHLRDYARAAHYVEQASRLEGSPPFLPFLAARFYSQGGDPQTAIFFLKGLFITTDNEKVREKLAQRILELEKEVTLQMKSK